MSQHIIESAAWDNIVVIRRTDQAAVPILVVDAYAINRDLYVNEPVRATGHPAADAPEANSGDDHHPIVRSDADPAAFVCIEFAPGDLADLKTLLIRGNVCGCECEVNGRRFPLDGAGSVHVVEVDTPNVVSHRPRIPGSPVKARYVVVRRIDRTKQSVALSGVHIRSTDYAEPWPVAAHMRPAGKPGAIRRLLDYSDYTVCETNPHQNAAIELDYGEDIPVYSVTLLTKASIVGCVVELLRGDDRSVVFRREINRPAVVQVLHTSTV